MASHYIKANNLSYPTERVCYRAWTWHNLQGWWAVHHITTSASEFWSCFPFIAFSPHRATNRPTTAMLAVAASVNVCLLCWLLVGAFADGDVVMSYAIGKVHNCNLFEVKYWFLHEIIPRNMLYLFRDESWPTGFMYGVGPQAILAFSISSLA